MKYDVRSACLALVKGRAPGSRRGPRPLALGWKLESGAVSPADIDALCASAQKAAPLRSWTSSAPLRALLIEYHAVRSAQSHSPRPQRSRCATRSARSA